MRWEFRLGNVMVSLCHGHGKENALESRVNYSWRDLFNKRMEPVKMKYG